MQEKLFRKSALDRLASPDRLDMLTQVIPFKAWLVPLAMLILIAAALFWGFFGRVPVTVSGQGILLHGGRIDILESPASGLLVDLSAKPGDTIQKGAVIGHISQLPDETLVLLTSPFDGQVIDIGAREGTYLQPGAQILKLDPVGEPLEALLFVFPADAKKLSVGMAVQLLPATVRQEETGYLLGTITYVGQLPVSQDHLGEVLGDGGLGGRLSSLPNPVEVRVTLNPDESTPGGYKWTSPRGSEAVIQNGTFTTGRIILRDIRPVDLLFLRQ